MISEIQFARIVSHLYDAVIVVDAQGLIADWNPGATRLLGYERETVVGRTLAALGADPDAPSLSELMARGVDDGGGWSGELTLPHSDGQARRCETRLVPLLDGAGEAAGMVVISRGASPQRHRLKIDQPELEGPPPGTRPEPAANPDPQGMRTVAEVAGGIAHYLNNQLSPVIIMTDLLLADQTLAEPARGMLEVIRQGVRGAAGEVARFGMLRRDLAGQGRAGPVDLYALMEGLPALMHEEWRGDPALGRGKIAFDAQLNPVPPAMGHAAGLRQCLKEVVHNAAEVMPRGGVIRLGLERSGDAIVCTVKDGGRGMTPLERRRCLEPFFTTKAAGAGLGLALCAGIVDRHRGTLSISSELGQGTLVTISLPLGATAGEAGATADPQPAPAALRVLYIDDEPIMRQTLPLLLHTLGHRTEVAEHGLAGIEKFKDQVYDAVICDFSMPGLNGREVAAAIKAIEPATAVILVTGWAADQLAPREGEAAPEDRVLEKPVTIDSLRCALNAAVGTGRR